jgi:hypothetical protein
MCWTRLDPDRELQREEARRQLLDEAAQPIATNPRLCEATPSASPA